MKRRRSGEDKEDPKEARIKVGRVPQLPELVIIDILSRLPIETIFKCRCVCKTFNKILKDPYFAQVHLSKSSINSKYLIIQNLHNSSSFLFVDMVDVEKVISYSSPQNGFFPPWKMLTMPSQPSHVSLSMTIRGSCNGLICLSYFLREGALQMICVCNPILGEFMLLPPPWNLELCYGLGFCPKTKKYKVVRFNSSSFTEIHTLGTNCWRKIDLVPHPARARICLDCSLLNDGTSLPFITESSKASHMICSFNFETEQYSYLPPPNHFLIENFHKRIYYDYVGIGLLGGLLCIHYILDKPGNFEVWVMKKYGVSESWTKEFTIDLVMLNCKGPNHLFSYMNFNQIHLTTVLDNGDMMLRYSCFQLLYYSHRKGTISDILDLSREGNENARIKAGYDVIDIVPSFISLRDITGGETVEVVKRSKWHNLS